MTADRGPPRNALLRGLQTAVRRLPESSVLGRNLS